MRTFLNTVLLFFLITSLHGQQIRFEQISEINGLTSNTVYQIAEDSHGYIWIAGIGGVACYNGKKIRNFTSKDGWPVETNIDRILIDNNDVLWVGARDTSLFIVENINSKNQIIHHYQTIRKITDIEQDHNGVVWVETDRHIYAIKNYKVIKDIPFQFELLDSDIKQDRIYVASESNGIYIYELNSSKKIHRTVKNGLLSNNCYSIAKTDKELYIGHDNGFTIITDDGRIIQNRSKYPSKVQRISIDLENRVWLSTDKGIKIFKDHILQYEFNNNNNKLPGYQYESVHFDKEGNSWLCNNGGGVLNIKALNIINFTASIDDRSPTYGLIQENDSTYWISSKDQQNIEKMTLVNGRASYDTIPTPGIDPTWATQNIINGPSIITGENGMVFINNGKLKVESNLNEKLSNQSLLWPFYNSYDSTVYIGSMNGVTKYKNGAYAKIYYYKDNNETVLYTLKFAFTPDHILLSSSDGIKELRNDSIIDIGEIDQLIAADAMVYSLVKDKNDQFYACINGDMIVRFWYENDQLKKKLYDLNKLFGIKGPFSLFTHENKFWLRSMEKVYQIELNSIYDEKIKIEKIIDEHDGLIKEAAYFTNFYIDSHDQLWLLSGWNMLRYDYKKDDKNKVETLNSIIQISLPNENDYEQYSSKKNRITELSDNPQIPNKLNEITFDFIGICHTSQNEVQYKTRLIGLNDNWSQATHQSSITYNNLSPGNYTFQFISCNNDGLWNKEPYSFKFTILPAWYQTWWFKLIIAILIAAVIYMFFLWRISVLKKEKNLQIKLTHDILASQEQERKRIAQDLHDGVGQELSMLKVNLEKLHDVTVTDKVNKIIEDIRFLSRNIHPHYFEKLGLTKAIEMIVEETTKLGKIYWVHELENVDQYFNSENQLMLFRVIQECMNNTIKHSGAKNAKVSIDITDSLVKIMVQDNGVGFDVNSEKINSLGLSTIRERVRSLNGTLDIKSKPGNGTQTEILIPRKK